MAGQAKSRKKGEESMEDRRSVLEWVVFKNPPQAHST